MIKNVNFISILSKFNINSYINYTKKINLFSWLTFLFQFFSAPFLICYLTTNSSEYINFQTNILNTFLALFILFLIISYLLNLINFFFILNLKKFSEFKSNTTINKVLKINSYISLVIFIFTPFVTIFWSIKEIKKEKERIEKENTKN